MFSFFFHPLGRDIIGLAETGSGKTGAFALPILNALLETPQRLFALVLTPTRELAFQISEQFEALGSSIGVQTGKFEEERSLRAPSLVENECERRMEGSIISIRFIDQKADMVF